MNRFLELHNQNQVENTIASYLLHKTLICTEKKDHVDYKNVDLLRRFVSDRGKIRPRRQTGVCAKHQRRLSVAIKRARHMALLPFVAEISNR